MGQIKASTIQQKFGFVDGDLKTPKHDEIMLWLDGNIQTILEDKYPRPESWREDSIRGLRGAYSSLRDLELPSIPEVWKITHKLTWEYAVMSGSYVVGFIDLRLEAVLPELGIKFNGSSSSVTWGISSDRVMINFEVKSSIPSLGELIRQIRFYQQYDKTAEYIVVCPDDRFAGQLKTQGIGFLKYPL